MTKTTTYRNAKINASVSFHFVDFDLYRMTNSAGESAEIDLEEAAERARGLVANGWVMV